MKIFAKKKKRSIHAFCRQRQYAHQPAGAAQQAQLAEIRTILRTPPACKPGSPLASPMTNTSERRTETLIG